MSEAITPSLREAMKRRALHEALSGTRDLIEYAEGRVEKDRWRRQEQRLHRELRRMDARLEP